MLLLFALTSGAATRVWAQEEEQQEQQRERRVESSAPPATSTAGKSAPKSLAE
ncbi:MAG: hypothetical protein JOZ52_02475, partial [Acidobacteria bacterium]|nr:hypothetical protein [Acidobacteriota bacterium]